MGLKQLVYDFAEEGLAKPEFASRPENLRMLKLAAAKSLDGFHTALTSPNAPLTWENRVILLGAAAKSERVTYKFPQNMDVVGFHPVLTDLGSIAPTFIPGNILPSMKDLDVLIDINNENILTSLEGLSSPVAGATRGGTFVSL